jgi:general secretion pathway protein F
MPVFAYKGMTQDGRATRGHLDADSLRTARGKLRREGIFLTEIAESSQQAAPSSTGGFELALRRFQRIPPLDLALATRQLSTLVGAGVALVEGLAALTDQVENPRLKGVFAQVRDRVNQGTSLADALSQSRVFPDLYIGMVRAGEAGGALEQVLERLAEYLESQVRLRNKVSSILIYPMVMFGFACLVVGVLVTVVLPQITQLLTSLNQKLPWYTELIIDGSNFLRAWWWAVAIAAIAAGVALRAAIHTERGRDLYDRMRLRAPVVGRVTRMLAISRFTRTLATLLAGGLPIVRALDTAKHVADNTVLGRAIDAARTSITEGASVARPLRASGEFPPLVTHMIEVGERSGELESMLAKVAETYEEQVETTVARLTALLEPFLILIMVGIVMVIILATLVPLLQVTTSLG